MVMFNVKKHPLKLISISLAVLCVPIVLMGTLSACGLDGKQVSSLKWWQKTNVYEIYINSFQDSDGDGYGDINGIRQRLDYLADLGVGAIWLTPVYASPMVDGGYDVSDYYAINPRYGTMEDMDALIREAKKKNIRVVMDLVFNHTSDQCQWFQESAKSKDNPYSDWYIWRDAKPGGGEPNNWRSIFGGSAWTWNEQRKQYYLHTFASAQPDLNWENPEVRKALFKVANYWVDKGVGGFRMDAIPYIKKPAGLPDGTPDDSEGRASIHAMTANTDGILDFLNEFKQQVTQGKDVFTVGEANGVKPEDLPQWVGDNGVLDMVFMFNHLVDTEVWSKSKKKTLSDLKKALTDSQSATAVNGWYPIFFENHDLPRSINAYFPEGADPVLAGKAMGTVLLALRGTPFIYQGEELGMTNVKWDSIDQYNDFNSHSQYDMAIKAGYSEKEALDFVHDFSRDNARTPMQWDASKNAGFTTGKPWLPLGDDVRTVNAEAEAKDPQSVLNWYKKLITFRRDNAVMIDGSYREVLSDSPSIYAFVRQDQSDKMTVLVNFTENDAAYDPKAAGLINDGKDKILLDNYEDGSGKIGVLRPYEAMIIR